MAETDKLIAEINKLVEDRTFTIEAAQRIAALRQHAEELEKKLRLRESDVEHKQHQIQQLEYRVSAQSTELENWGKREKELALREAKITSLEKDTAVAYASLSAFREVTGMFLRNTLVREAVQRTVPVRRATGQGGCMSDYVEAHQQTETVTRETE